MPGADRGSSMSDLKLPPTVGMLGCLLVLFVVFAPFVLLSGGEATGLSTYYDAGLVGPWVVALFALVATVVFAAGRQGRTDPETAAGATLVLGLFMTMLAAQWAVAVDPALVLGLTTQTWMEQHRWVLTAVTLVVPGTAVWYARALGLV